MSATDLVAWAFWGGVALVFGVFGVIVALIAVAAILWLAAFVGMLVKHRLRR